MMQVFVVFYILLAAAAAGCPKALPYEKLANVKKIVTSKAIGGDCVYCEDNDCSVVIKGSSHDSILPTSSSVAVSKFKSAKRVLQALPAVASLLAPYAFASSVSLLGITGLLSGFKSLLSKPSTNYDVSLPSDDALRDLPFPLELEDQPLKREVDKQVQNTENGNQIPLLLTHPHYPYPHQGNQLLHQQLYPQYPHFHQGHQNHQQVHPFYFHPHLGANILGKQLHPHYLYQQPGVNQHLHQQLYPYYPYQQQDVSIQQNNNLEQVDAQDNETEVQNPQQVNPETNSLESNQHPSNYLQQLQTLHQLHYQQPNYHKQFYPYQPVIHPQKLYYQHQPTIPSHSSQPELNTNAVKSSKLKSKADLSSATGFKLKFPLIGK